ATNRPPPKSRRAAIAASRRALVGRSRRARPRRETQGRATSRPGSIALIGDRGRGRGRCVVAPLYPVLRGGVDRPPRLVSPRMRRGNGITASEAGNTGDSLLFDAA